MTRVVAILQARMGSVRLPGKVMAPIGSRPLLEHIIRRTCSGQRVAALVLATSTQPEDDALEALASRLHVPCVRGSVDDVLDRYHAAAQAHDADVIVRLTGDNPLVDRNFVDYVVERFLDAGVSYVDTMTSGTYPYGLSVEVVSSEALDEAWRQARSPAEREHVTMWIRRHSDRWPALHLAAAQNDSDLRWTVDVLDDLTHIRQLFEELHLEDLTPDYAEIVRHERRSIR